MVVHKILGSSGQGGTDSEALQGWILKLREDITRLCTSVENYVGWLANGSPPWAAYRTFMSVRIIALDKQPGVRPVGVGETWRRLFSKILLKFTGPESTMAFQVNHLCAGIKSVIDGAIHGVKALWYKNSSTEDWGFLLVDAKNAFNKINRFGILWTVRHLWPSGARFDSIFIVTVHCFSYIMGMGRPVFCIVKRVWRREILSQ